MGPSLHLDAVCHAIVYHMADLLSCVGTVVIIIILFRAILAIVMSVRFRVMPSDYPIRIRKLAFLYVLYFSSTFCFLQVPIA